MPVQRAHSDVLLATAHEDPTAEVARLRALLERQPACLMRIGVGGALLAVSDAALTLLGGQTLAQVLGTSLVDRMCGDAGEVWMDFVRRVLQAGSASLECEMDDLAGVRRAVVLHGISLPTHPDGDDSLLVTVRDVTTTRRLEASLRARLDAALAERAELAAVLDQLKMALGTAIDSALLARQIVEKGSHGES